MIGPAVGSSSPVVLPVAEAVVVLVPGGSTVEVPGGGPLLSDGTGTVVDEPLSAAGGSPPVGPHPIVIEIATSGPQARRTRACIEASISYADTKPPKRP